MHRISPYRLRQLGAQLKRGAARIIGRSCDGHAWPEGNHYWIIEDLRRGTLAHVPTAARPSWRRYVIPYPPLPYHIHTRTRPTEAVPQKEHPWNR